MRRYKHHDAMHVMSLVMGRVSRSAYTPTESFGPYIKLLVTMGVRLSVRDLADLILRPQKEFFFFGESFVLCVDIVIDKRGASSASPTARHARCHMPIKG